jgi:hypothetical protein
MVPQIHSQKKLSLKASRQNHYALKALESYVGTVVTQIHLLAIRSSIFTDTAALASVIAFSCSVPK